MKKFEQLQFEFAYTQRELLFVAGHPSSSVDTKLGDSSDLRTSLESAERELWRRPRP